MDRLFLANYLTKILGINIRTTKALLRLASKPRLASQIIKMFTAQRVFRRAHNSWVAVVDGWRIILVNTKYLLSVGHLALAAALAASTSYAQTADGEIVLDPITVEGASEDSVLDSFDGYSAEAATSATRVPGDLRTTPRSVTVVGEEQILDQGARTIEQAIGYAPGVATQTFGLDGRYDQYAIRGFDAQNAGNYRDGLPLRTFGFTAWRTDPFLLDRVEVLRGATADLYGSNEPGGLVNSVTKRPEFDFGATARASAVSEGGGELALDVTGPLSSDLAYRLTGVFNESGTVFDEVDQGRILFAPSVTWQPSNNTKLTIFGQYQEDDIGDTYVLLPEYGTLQTNPLGQFDDDFYTGNPDRNTIESEQSYIGYELEQDLGSNLTWLSRARFARNDWFNETSYPGAFFASSGIPDQVDTAIMIDFDVDETVDQISFDNGLQTELDFGNVNTTLITGIDYYRADIDAFQRNAVIGNKDLNTGVIAPNPTAPFVEVTRDEEVTQTGVYALANTEIGDSVVVNAGLRHDFVEREGSQSVLIALPPAPSTTQLDLDNEQQFTSASLGASYNFENGTTLYGNAARSFNLPPAGFDENNDPLDVEESDSFELGARFRPVGTGSLFSIALFDITKKNVAQATGSVQNQFEQIGEVRSRGVEVGGAYAFTNGVSFTGSYTYIDAEITDDPRNEGNRFARIPENTATLWVNYEPSSLEGLSVGAGVRYIDERFSDSANTETRKAPESTLFDASMSYTFNDWEASLAVRNLADERDVTFCTGGDEAVLAFLPAPARPFAGGCAIGEGRTITVGLTRRF